MSAQPQSPAPEPPSCSCAVVRDRLEPARCRCYVEPVIELSGTFGLTECSGFEEVTRGAELTAQLLERTREQVLTSELHSYLAAGAELAEPTRPVQRPSLGRIVHVLVHPHLNNGTDVAPAVITRVHGQTEAGRWVVNLRVFLDGNNHAHEWARRRELHADEASARAAVEHSIPDHPVWGVGHAAFWPARA